MNKGSGVNVEKAGVLFLGAFALNESVAGWMSTAYLLAFGALPCSGTHLVLVPLCCVSLCYSQISLPLSSQWLRPTSKLIRYLFRAVLVWGRHKILGPDAGSQGQQNPCLVHRDIRTHVPAPDTKCLLFHLVDGGMS